VLGIAALVISAGTLPAQQPSPPYGPPHRGDTAWMQTMMAQHSMMMMTMDSLNGRLDSLVNLMNKAKGDKKVTAMAAVINELVEQRRAMQHRMGEMMRRRSGMGPAR
jgi:hypothetical protein